MTADLSSTRPERVAQAIDLAVFLLACVVLLPSSITAITDSPLPAAWRWADIAAAIALHLVLLTYRRWPVATYVAACCAMAVLTFSPNLVGGGERFPAALLPSALLFFFALYGVALRRSARDALIALGVAVAGGVLVSYRLGSATGWTSQFGGDRAGWLILTGIAVLGSVAAWALGRLRSTRLAFLAELQERARRTEEDRRRETEQAAAAERARIAAEMHDVVSHSLAVIVSQAEGGRMIAKDQQTRDVLQTIGSTGRTALTDMRAMLGVLRSDDVRRGSPQQGVAEIADLAAKSGASFAQNGEPAPVSAAVGLAAYRIVQESLTNSLKHGSGGASVHLDWTGRLTITVTNPAAAASDSGTGSGIIGMRQRAEAAGGTLSTTSSGDAWAVRAVLPLEGK